MNRKQRRAQQKKSGTTTSNLLQKPQGVQLTTEQAFKMARAKHEDGNWLDAEHMYKELLNKVPGHTGAWHYLSVLMSEQDRMQEAIALAENAIRLDNKNPVLFFNLARLYNNSGFNEEGKKMLDEAYRLNPNSASIINAIARNHKYDNIDSNIVNNINRLLDISNLEDEEKSLLFFALAKIHDDCKKHDQAFEYYLQANALKFPFMDFKPERLDYLYHKNKEIFTSDFFKKSAHRGSQFKTPVYIVGMPRSGTTLAEQILSSHPQAHGTGELDTIFRVACTITQRRGIAEPFDFFNVINEVSDDELLDYAQQLEQRLRRDSSNDSKIFIDKMPTNFNYIGLIGLLFPNAKIINCQRNAMDCCVSNFMQPFANGNSHSYDLKACAQFYNHYERMMDYWQDVSPLPIYNLNYENLVANQEEETRKLLDFVGVDWNDACLDFHKNKRTVRTASTSQVREPMNNKSVEKWRKYKKYLAPLIDELNIDK